VWISFVFLSDADITYSEGAYIDNIVLRKRTGLAAEQPLEAFSCDVVRQGDYVVDPCAALTIGVPPKSGK